MNEEVRAPDKEKIKKDYLSGIKPKELSDKYNISINTLKSWIKRYGWSKNATKEGAPRKHKGAPLNNTNAEGHGAPPENKNAEKYGFFAKFLPPETKEIFDAVAHADPLDLLWHQIQLAYAAIVRAQQVAYVKDQSDMSKTKIQHKDGDTVTEERWEVQFAWDKQANFMKAQARAQGELRSMIKQYDELLHKNWELATEEQKRRITLIKAQADKLSGSDNQAELKRLDEVLGEIKGVI